MKLGRSRAGEDKGNAALEKISADLAAIRQDINQRLPSTTV